MGLRTRLFLTCVAIAAIVAAPALYGIQRLGVLRDIAFDQRARHAAAYLAVGRLQAGLASVDRYIRSYVAAPDSTLRVRMHDAIDESLVQAALLHEAGYGDAARRTGARLDSLRIASRHLDSLVEAGEMAEATAFLEAMKPDLTAATASLEAIAREIDRRSLADLEEARSISATARRTAGAAFALALGIALLAGLWIAHAITSPLLRLRRATATVAGGRFQVDPDLPYQRSDEIGDLSRSFRSMAAKLAELDRIKAEFISMASHDLRTPVSIITGYAQLAEEGAFGEPGEEMREALAAIQDQARVLTRLSTQLLDIGRIEAGGLTIVRRETDIARLLAAIERNFAPMAERQEIDFRIEADPAVPRTITADGDLLRDQVLGNLIGNAFKFTPAGGRIRVRAWVEED